jgi:Tol biopolymer transport system component
MTHCGPPTPILFVLVTLALALPAISGAALAQEPAPPAAIHLPWVANTAADGVDLAYTRCNGQYTVSGRWTYPHRDVVYHGRVLLPIDATAVRGLVWSPDGMRLAVDFVNAAWGRWVRLYDAGGTPIALPGGRPPGEVVGNDPAWSPDGRFLAYAQSLALEHHIVIVSSDGTLVRQIEVPRDAYGLAWSPDGTRIAYVATSTPVEDVGDLRLVWADGTGDVLLAPGVTVDKPAWSPDGRWIAYLDVVTFGDQDLRLASADGAHDILLSQNASSVWGPPTWSPDGSRLAHGLESADDDLVISTVADGGLGLDLTLIGCRRDPVWSPDGRYLAYGGEGGIKVVLADGSAPRVFAPGHVPAWSPDGKYLAFSTNLLYGVNLGGCRDATVVFEVEDPSPEPHLVLSGCSDPAWRPRP